MLVESSRLALRTRVCTRCPERGPQSWENFYAAAKWPDGTMRRPQSRCKDCMRELAREWNRWERRNKPQQVKARDDRARQRVLCDPERAAAKRAQDRHYYRTRRSLNPTPEKWIDHAPVGNVPSAPVREAVADSGVPLEQIAIRINRDSSALGRRLRADTMPIWWATAILDAIDVLPAEVGL